MCMAETCYCTPLWQPGDAAKPRSGYRSAFSHTTEKASPGYYTVQLDDYNVKVELTATEHVGFKCVWLKPTIVFSL